MEIDTAMAKELKENGVWVPLTPAKPVQVRFLEGHAAADSKKEGDDCDGLLGNWNSSGVRIVSDYEEAKHCAAKDYSAGVANNFGVVGSGNSSGSLESWGLHQTPKVVTGGISDNGVIQETTKVEVQSAWIRVIELKNEHRQYNFGLKSSTAKASDAQKNQNPKKMSNPGVSLNKKKRLKTKRHRPKIFDASKPKKIPKSKVNPSTPKQKTPKRCIPGTSPLHKSKCMRKAKEREVIGESGESSRCAVNSCRQRLDFNLENEVRDQNGQDNYWVNEGKINSKVIRLSIQNDDHGQMEAGFQMSTNSLNVHEEAVEPISHRAAKSSIDSLNDDFPSQARANFLEGMTPKTYSGQTDNLIPKECEESCKESIKLNFDFNLEVQDFDSSSRTTAITLQYQRRKKSLNNSALEKELNGDVMIDKPEADSKVQSGCRFSNSLDYKRILRSNKCLRHSRKIGPNWPKIYKKKRMKRRGATASRNFFYTKVADECEKKVDRCIRQKVTPNSAAHRNVKKNFKRLSSPKFSKRTSQKRAKKCELSSDSAIGKYNLSVILPTQRQRIEAMNDPESFYCVWRLCPMANFRKKRSWILKQRQRYWGAHLSAETETNESMRHPKPHECALTLTRFVKAKRKRSMTSIPRHNISSFCYVPRTFLPKVYSVRNENQDDEQEKLEVHIEDNQHLDMQYLIEIPYFEGRHLDQNNLLSSQNEDAYGKAPIDFISQKLESLHIDDGGNQLVVQDKKVHGAILPYKGKFDPSKRRKPPPKIDLDAETMRVWKLLMENDGSEDTKEVDVDKEKWWENEREVFRGRIDSFISRMHLIQGDRRFSPWKGSVVDSVVGVFLTQNVSDHLSSSAFMSLAARFPSPSVTDQSDYKNTVSRQESVDGNKADCGRSTDGNNEQPFFRSTEQDLEKSCICSTAKSVEGDVIICEDAVQGIPDSSSRANSNTSSRPCNSEDSAIYRELLQAEENKFLQQFCSHEEKKMSNVESTSDKKFGDSQSSTHAFSSDKTSDLDGNAASCSPQSINLMGDLGNIKIEDSGDIGKSHGSTEGKKKRQVKDKQENPVNWDDLRKKYSHDRSKDAVDSNIDSVNWEAVRQSTVQEVAKVIMERGMNNILAGRIKDFLDRLVQDHGIIDLEWLRDVPPDKTKNYLLSIPGLGLKSTECVRLLTLHHHAFPVDTNVGRILVRLGWVPLLPLPEDVQIHLLNQYPLVDTIQKYIWPRLCTFRTQILYEFHYQMITFGKVFCTKIRPNCNACPMRGQCKHFASAYASARLRLQVSSVESKISELPVISSQDLTDMSPLQLVNYDGDFSGVGNKSFNSEPIVEFPPSPEPASRELLESDIEDFSYQAEDEIPSIKLNTEEFSKNILDFMEKTCFLSGEAAVSKELVALSPEAASIPMPKLKYVSRLRTVHQVYELPDSHPLLAGFEKREPDDPCPYLLAIWTADETANSSQQPGKVCNCQESTKCDMDACCSADTVQKQIDELIQGTILIPCRTANRGSFPLNGTYFQVNEVFADHESSRHPIAVPRKWIWNLRRRALYCGTSTTSIFRGLSTDEIQYCFWRGFICVRGMDRVSRAARPLARRFHICKTRLVDEE